MRTQKKTWFFFVLVALSLISVEASAIIGRPLTPFSFAGVARRSVRRTAYVGAAAYGAGAYGGYGYGGYGYGETYAPAAAPVYVLPSGCTPNVNCGGTTYVPQYQGTNVVYVPQ